MLSLVVWVAAGAGIGAAMGYFGQCTSGACPLTSTWWRGTLYGAGMGFLFFLASGSAGSDALNQSTPNVRRISPAEFETEVVQSPLPVLVDFYAPWCASCKSLAPALERMAAELTNQVRFVKVNVAEASELAGRHGVEGVPTLITFANGKPAQKIAGPVAPEELLPLLLHLTKSSPPQVTPSKSNPT